MAHVKVVVVVAAQGLAEGASLLTLALPSEGG
jgi:hypothetical protein